MHRLVPRLVSWSTAVCGGVSGEKLANPITPLYKDPASVEAELQLQSHMQRAAAAQAHAQMMNNAMGRQAGHKQGSREHVAADPRDTEIDQVRRRRGEGRRWEEGSRRPILHATSELTSHPVSHVCCPCCS